MWETLKYLFNWKKNPESVFYTAIPLAVLAFGLQLFVAYLKWKDNNDPWFMIIWVAAILLLFVALIPAYKMRKRMQKLLSTEKDNVSK